MGSDKAFLEFGGRTLLERAIETVGEVCGVVTIVGDAAKFASYGPVVADLYPGCGPLAGIHAALSAFFAELNLVMAVDMPFVSGRINCFSPGDRFRNRRHRRGTAHVIWTSASVRGISPRLRGGGRRGVAGGKVQD